MKKTESDESITTKILMIRIEPQLMKQLKIYAACQGTSMSDIVRKLIRKEIKLHGGFMCQSKPTEKQTLLKPCHQCGEDADPDLDGEEPICTRCSKTEQEIQETNRWLYYHAR